MAAIPFPGWGMRKEALVRLDGLLEGAVDNVGRLMFLDLDSLECPKRG